MRENKYGILAIQETHLTDELAEQFEALFGNRLRLVHSPDPTTRNARGMALVFNKSSVDTANIKTEIIVPGRAITATVPWNDGTPLKILAVYSPNAPKDIREFWKTVRNKLNANPALKPNIVLGDFNLVEDAIDRLPCNADDQLTTNALRDFKISNNLIDGWREAHPEEKGYTWTRESDGTQSRIDRIYIKEDFFTDCKDWCITQPPIPTDHDIVSAKITTASSPKIGRGRWAIPTRLFKNKKIKEELQKLGLDLERELKTPRPRSTQRNPQTLLRNFKTKAINAIRKHEKTMQPIIKMRIEKLSEKLKATRNDPNLPLDEKKITTVQIKREIQNLVKESHQRNRDKLAAIDAAEGESIGKTWSNRHKANKPRDTIKELHDPETNETTKDSKRMAQIAARHHDGLQNIDHDPRNPPDTQSLNEILRPIKTKLSEASKAKLSEPISEEDVLEALKKTANEKAPGLDGIPTELWKSLCDQFTSTPKDNRTGKKCDIVWALTQVFQDIEVNGMDANAKLNEGCVSPIYKKKNPEDIANYRPITLLNTDYKIFTKALSIKLADAAPEIIHPDQAGFISGRSIFDQVKTTKMVIDYMERTSNPGAVIALDQEKAYDKILHPYLWEVLRKFEFPNRFINTVRALYDNATSTVMINGEMSDPFEILRGVRQGDALSCLLFDIAIEPLAENIRASERLKGIQIPGTRKYLKVKLFADDTTVILSEEDNIEDLQQILTRWCKVSGAKFNIDKTEIIPLGNKKQRDETLTSRRLNATTEAFPGHIHIAKEGEPVRILGAWLGNNIDQAVTWAPIIDNVHKRLKRWGAAKHLLEGRRLIIQMQVAGVTQYLTKVQGMPRSIENDLNTQIRKFMWNYEKHDSVNQAQMHAKHKKGGKKVLDIEARNKAIHLTWLKAYLNIGEDRPTWAYFADAIIGMDIPDHQQISTDPEARIMPIIQTWETRTRNSTLPEDLRNMLKLAKEYDVHLSSPNPSTSVKLDLPLWYHAHSAPAARKKYRTNHAKCLRNKHKIRLVRDAVSMLNDTPDNHEPRINCNCDSCRRMRAELKCSHPYECINMAAFLLKQIKPKWSPQTTTQQTAPTPDPAHQDEQNEDERTFEKGNETTTLKEAIRIFGRRPE